MKKKSVLLIIFVVVIALTAFAGCNQIEKDEIYYQYLYDKGAGSFKKTGAAVIFSDNYRFTESYVKYDGADIVGEHQLTGSYDESKENKLIIGTYDTPDIEKFKRDYKKELEKAGYNKYDVENIVKNISGRSDYYSHKKYVYKVNSLVGARVGDKDENWNTIDGMYLVTSAIDSKTKTGQLLFSKGLVYDLDPKINVVKDKIYPLSDYTDKVGSYTVDGDFMSFTSERKDASGTLPPPLKMLLAELAVPKLYVENVNENGLLDENSVLKVDGVRTVKVLTNNIFSHKEL